jgi:diamine N-acetyltransferase
MSEINPSAVKIKLATTSDVNTLLELSANTFYQAFAGQNTEANMAAYMTSAFTASQLSEEIKDPACIFFLAFMDEEAVGYSKLRKNKSHKNLKGAKAIEIHRLYVLKKMVGKKIGKALMEKCLEVAKRENYEVVWLGVWEHNTHAINFYKSWGFEVFSSYVFKLGDDAQTDLLMKKEII